MNFTTGISEQITAILCTTILLGSAALNCSKTSRPSSPSTVSSQVAQVEVEGGATPVIAPAVQ